MRAAAPWALVLAVLLAAPPSRGDDGSDRKAAAEALFDQARQLMVEKRFAEACPKLVESQRLDPGIGTRLFLADCYEHDGRTASAWAEFREAAATASQQHDSRAAVAGRRASALEARLTKLVIVVSPDASVAGLEVRRDGLVVPAAEIGVAIPVDPGIHAVQASAPSRATWSTTVQLPMAAGSVSVNIPVLEAASAQNAGVETSAPPPALAPSANFPEPQAASRDETPDGHAQRTWGIVVGSAGLVGLVLGTTFGLHAMTTYDGANSSGECQPDNVCNSAGRQSRSDADGWATASPLAFVLGGAAVAGGVVLYLTAPRAPAATSLRLTPSAGGVGAAFAVERAW
jgi:hypothetical protein